MFTITVDKINATQEPDCVKCLSSKHSRSFIWIVTQTSNGIDWSLCRLSHQMRLLNSAMGLTTHKTCIYLSAAKSSFMFFPLPFFSVRPVVVCGVYLFKAHISLQFYPRSTCSTPSTLVKEKKKINQSVGDSLFHCSVAHDARKLGHLGRSWTLKLRWKPQRRCLGVVFARDGRGCRPALTLAWHSFQVCASNPDA